MIRSVIAVVAAAMMSGAAAAAEIGIVAFQMSSDTHARTANAAADHARAAGLEATVLNSEGAVPKHAEQVDTLIQKGVDGIILAMGKTQELDAQLEAAKAKGIPVITVMSGTSPHTAVDGNVNEAA